MTEDDQEAPHDGGAGTAPAERQVIVICEECGKKYSFVPSRILGRAAGFTCRRCGHRIVVAKPPGALPEGPAPPAAAAVEYAAPPRSHRKRSGLRAVMVGIVLVFPLLVMAGAAFVFLQQMEGLLSDLGRHCSQAAGQRVEERIPGASAAGSLEEPAGSAIRIQAGIAAFAQEAGTAAALILGGAFLAAVLVVLIFGLRLAERVRTLADAAARISTGDLAVEVETGSRDELGILAEALARLRENLRLSREQMSR
ncbi:MAG: HAMP domain-containing protein [Deltaproteobacteria bacterium]|nr:HAMP domain-containing protein [Deltaproteobacteria bacterium]